MTSFFDLPSSDFPFSCHFFRGGQEIHVIEVPGPGAVAIPALGEVSRVELRFPDGRVVTRPGSHSE